MAFLLTFTRGRPDSKLPAPLFLRVRMTPHRPGRVSVLAAGQSVEAAAVRHHPLYFQTVLQFARKQYGSALCGCVTPHLKLVIRERNSKLFLAAWPNEADKHAADCPFFSEQASGASGYTPEAIQDHGDHTRLELAHALLQEPKRSPAERAEPQRSPGDARPSLHLWGLLHFLWSRAGLNRWYPGWSRDWGFVRHALRGAAHATQVATGSLQQSLYVPPPWNSKKKAEIEDHWQAFLAPLVRNPRGSGKVASGFVIGEVRALECEPGGSAVILLRHHAPEFFLDRLVVANVARYSHRGWSALKRLEVDLSGKKPQVVAALRVEATKAGRMVVVEGVLMRVSARYVPVNSSYEDLLATILVEQDREFVRPLHYDNHGTWLPHFVLRDVEGEGGTRGTPYALQVYGASIAPFQKERIALEDRERSTGQGLRYWAWDAAKQPAPPPLPTRHSRSVPARDATGSSTAVST